MSLICPTQYSRVIEQEQFFDPHSTAVDQDETADPEADVETETTLQTELLVQCISDCFEEFCLEDRMFDLKRFARLTEAFFWRRERTILWCVEIKRQYQIQSSHSFDEKSLCRPLIVQDPNGFAEWVSEGRSYSRRS